MSRGEMLEDEVESSERHLRDQNFILFARRRDQEHPTRYRSTRTLERKALKKEAGKIAITP